MSYIDTVLILNLPRRSAGGRRQSLQVASL
jgi:hypothetical protein